MNKIIAMIEHVKGSNNISDEAMRNYHFLWTTFNNDISNFTIFCTKKGLFNCSNIPLEFKLAKKKRDFETINSIRDKSIVGEVVEGQATAAPCTYPDTVKKFKIKQICDLHATAVKNIRPFLMLMKFTKQSPVFMEEETEHNSLSAISTESSSKFRFKVKTENTTQLKAYTFSSLAEI